MDKKYISDYSLLLLEWDEKKNIGVFPQEISAGSTKKIWWKCSSCGNSWQAVVYSRTSGSACPKCARQQRQKTARKNSLKDGQNSFAQHCPELIDEWYFERNNPTKPVDVSYGSGVKVWWKCKNCENIWQARVADRSHGKGCPICAKQKQSKTREQLMLQAGTNSLYVKSPRLAEEWDYELNYPLTPQDVTYSSGKSVWWRCKVCGNSWKSKISNRQHGRNCPQCSRIYHSSLPEYIISYYLSKIYPDLITSYKPDWLFPSEIDIYIPSLHLGIEYDGQQWHRSIQKDIKKNSLVNEHGISLLRVREVGCPDLGEGFFVIQTKGSTNDIRFFGQTVNEIIAFIDTKIEAIPNGKIPTINVEDDYLSILASFSIEKESKSLSIQYPHVAEEWNYEKNDLLKPTQISSGSSRRVWWKCKTCNYEWKARVAHRTVRGVGCPACAGSVVWQGYNDLETLNPVLAEEWNYTKNTAITPRDVTSGSKIKVWWKCKTCNYEWETSVVHRSGKGRGCPACAGKVLLKGYNDLRTKYPEIAREWHPTNNDKLTSEDVTTGLDLKVWWLCKDCGNEWQASLANRTKGRGCPVCAQKNRADAKKITALRNGDNSLAAKHPDKIKEWHYSLNMPLTPDSVNYGSKESVWWLCSDCGHEWKMPINERAKGRGCPVCGISNRGKTRRRNMLLNGKPSLADEHPEIVSEWDNKKNAPLTPYEFTSGSKKKVWWKCSVCGNEWETSIQNRSKGHGCSVCGHKKRTMTIRNNRTDK